MKLVIVESFNKVKSIKKFLGKDFEVIASGGHIRELKKAGYGFNKETLEPIWELYTNKNGIGKSNSESIINDIKKTAKESEKIYLATDPDREGEAISWHLYDLLKDKKIQDKCQRITFNEITKKAIEQAVLEPRDIDLNLVYSQWARRLLDRIVGYGLSSLVNSKLNAISAGRVQSVALLFIVERYLQIQNFVPEYWWTIETSLKSKDKKSEIPVHLRSVSFECETFGPKSDTEFKFAKEDDAKKCLDLLSNKFIVYNIDEPTLSKSKVLSPFQTDTLLTEAFSKLGWATYKTQKVAQELYNGVDIDGVVTSLISYPRTDTNRLNVDFISSTRDFICNEYGEEYVSMNAKDANVGPLVQGAHEGIRPIDIKITPKSLEGKIKDKDANNILKLYTLIWTRTVASFMKVPVYKQFIVRFINNEQKFYTSYKRLHFIGYHILPHYEKNKLDSDIDLSYLKVGDELVEHSKASVVKHSTEPKPLYNEGTLVKELKKSGVGRPSTYSTMVNVVRSRGYVKPGKELSPTDIGISLITSLTKEFSQFISKEFTSKMETELDEIAEGNKNWNDWIRAFKKDFDKAIADAKQNMEKKADELVGSDCPKCNSPLVYKINRRDRSTFIGCSGFPKCTFIESLKPKSQPKILDEVCPQCNKNLVERQNKRNEPFIGCSGFPKCRFIKSIKKDNKSQKPS